MAGEARVAQLRSQLLDADDKLSLLKLKISELEYQKREHQLDDKLSDYIATQSKQTKERDLQKLRESYQKNMDKQQELTNKMNDLQSQQNTADITSDRLHLDNDALKSRVNQMQSQVDFKQKENAHWRNKKLYEVRLSENEIWKREQEKLALKNKVDHLNEEYKTLDNNVQQSLVQQNESREILNHIKEFDKENQQLKGRIEELQQKLNTLKK